MKPISDVLEAASAAEAAGHWDTALDIYHEALEEWEPLGGAPTCDLLRKIGLVHYHRGDFEIALNLFSSSRRLATEAGLTPQIATATNCLAIVHQARGQLDLAHDLYRTAQGLAKECGNAGLAVKIDQNLGIIACIRGDTDEALAYYESALAYYREHHHHVDAARVLNNSGMVHADLENWDEAEQAYDAAIAEISATSDVETLGTIQLNRAELYVALDRFDDARACCDQAFEAFSRIGSASGLGETYRAYGALYRKSGKLHLAEAHLKLVAELARTADDPLLEAEAEAGFALVHLAAGRNPDALKSLNRAHALFSDLRARREIVDLERSMDRLEETYLRVVEAWGDSIESVDRYTSGHCSRVADYTCLLAEAVGISGRELTWLRMGAFLHDVGKTKVDVAILNKPGKLDPREWDEMRRHTVAGDEIVAELGFPYDIRAIVRNHHERWDGTGYPDRLAGEQIPLNARILCLADVYDALTSSRSYRAELPAEEARAIMRDLSGAAFDPSLLELFLRIIPEVNASGTTLSSASAA